MRRQTKTSVIASLIAAGYSVGDDALKRAREYDDKHSISEHIKVGAQILKAKVDEIDQKLGITEKAAIVRDGYARS